VSFYCHKYVHGHSQSYADMGHGCGVTCDYIMFRGCSHRNPAWRIRAPHLRPPWRNPKQAARGFLDWFAGKKADMGASQSSKITGGWNPSSGCTTPLSCMFCLVLHPLNLAVALACVSGI
jgi:hypothetical protein